ncbi:hypothetical protein BDZ85DRAFT_83697 [Elsinoe ampelina]|uniref:Atos-like conserved domain-containing protein n=1 Tax=Elsinoe ampelina TaxID=302913 RepID=A0A6A6GGE7_9PEZI|nr:hypothetical protein BDZ85DRAFT_83697 [Elsinoe ampelina]
MDESMDPDLEGRPASRTSERESSPTAIYNPYFTGRPRTPTHGARMDAMDRQQIIRKIKEKGIARQRSREAQLALASKSDIRHAAQEGHEAVSPSALLPSPHIERSKTPMQDQEQATAGLSISRPRSALHRGDFSGDAQSVWTGEEQGSPRPGPGFQQPNLTATSPPAPWHDGYPNSSVHRARVTPTPSTASIFTQIARPRAVSQVSLSKSFSYQAPTSPLVNQSNAEDFHESHDLPLPNPDYASDRFGRRRTFSPRSLQSFANMIDNGYGSQWSSSPPSIRRESTIPYKAHQPRRSVTSLNSLPQTPYSTSRRSSTFGSSPLQSAMVGSFEESILRGRMSSKPSRPLDFTAHIGVLGMGDCKPSLRCPPHITIPFPAVYYSYGTSSTTSDSQPSPYVGLVDLEQTARPDSELGPRKRQNLQRRTSGQGRASSPSTADLTGLDVGEKRRRQQKQRRRRSRSPLEEPKNAYRIPAKGQLQIIIKNPNKTAVKLFLIPYDVTDIQPGQKTFIRQRSYSAGPIIDMPLDYRKNFGTDRPEAALSGSNDPRDKPVLRYLIHLHMCCTSKGRIWLYNSIRVVFANRVPDGKEKLRNEIQLPEPKYSAYKPGRTSVTATPQLRPHHSEPSPMDIDGIGEFTPPSPLNNNAINKFEARSLPAVSIYDSLFTHRHTEPSFRFPVLETVTSRPSSRGVAEDGTISEASRSGSNVEHSRVKSPKSPLSPYSPLQRAISPVTDSSEGTGSITFSRSSSTDKLSTGSESLLSRRLRDLGMSRVPSPCGGPQNGQ